MTDFGCAVNHELTLLMIPHCLFQSLIFWSRLPRLSITEIFVVFVFCACPPPPASHPHHITMEAYQPGTFRRTETQKMTYLCAGNALITPDAKLH